MRRKIIVATLALAVMGFVAAPAIADHSSVVNPSGCHETNINGGPSNGKGQGTGGNGGGGWHNSAFGHERAVANGAHQAGGCLDIN